MKTNAISWRIITFATMYIVCLFMFIVTSSSPAQAYTAPSHTYVMAQTDEAGADCDASWSSPLSWILCPVIEGSTGFVDFVFDSVVKPMLEQDAITTDTKSGVYIAWSQFRILANVLLVASLLAVVYSQARGGK